MEYIFFKTCLAGTSKIALRALSNQQHDLKAIEVTKNVTGTMQIINQYPLGTYFATSSFHITGRDSYVVSNLWVLDDSPKVAFHEAPAECKKAFEDYISNTMDSDSVEIVIDVDEAKETPHKKTFLTKLQKNSKLKKPTIENDGFYVTDNTWWLLIRNIKSQINTMLIGETGTGKTELVMRACKKLNLECNVYDMGSMYDPMAGLLGTHRLKNGGSIFDYSKFTEDIQKPGVILLDELSRAPIQTNNILFPLLDSRRTLKIEIAGSDDVREIKVHPDCTFIATANIGAEYTGTMSMDKALVNRFFPMELEYLPLDIESDLLQKRSKIDRDDAIAICTLSASLREKYRLQELSTSISTRETLMVADLVHDGWGLVDAIQLVVLPMYEGNTMEGERSIVIKLMATR